MAKLYGNIASSALMTFDKSFARANGQPLDSTEVYYSLAEAKTYAAGAGAYVGQKIVVIENNVVTHYSIEDTAGNLKELGSKPVGDGQSISVAADGTVSIFGFDKLTSAAVGYIPQIKEVTIPADPENGIEESKHLEIEWVAKYDDTALAGRVSDLEGVVGKAAEGDNAATGLVKAVADAESNAKAYTDTEINGLDVSIAKKTFGEGEEAVEKECIILKNKAGTEIAYADAAKFVQDSFLDDVKYEDGKIKFTWLMGDGTTKTDEVAVSDFVQTYTAGTGISITNNVVSIDTSVVATSSALSSVATIAEAAQTADEVASAISNALTAYTTSSDLQTALDGKQDKITSVTVKHTDATSSNESFTLSSGSLALVIDAYSKSETEAKIDEKIASVTGGESAADVKLALESYRTALNKEVWGEAAADWTTTTVDEDGKTIVNYNPVYSSQSRIDIAELAISTNSSNIIVNSSNIAVNSSNIAVLSTNISNVSSNLDALSDMVGATGSSTNSLAYRIGQLEVTSSNHALEYSTLNGKVNTINTVTIPALTQGIADAEANAETYASNQIAALSSNISSNYITKVDSSNAISSAIGALEIGKYITSAQSSNDIKEAIDTLSTNIANTYITSTQSSNDIADAIDALSSEINIGAYITSSTANATFAKIGDAYTKSEADAEFMTQDEVDARINTLIAAADPEDGKTITNIQNLVKYVDENAGQITELISTVSTNSSNISALQVLASSNSSNIEDILVTVSTNSSEIDELQIAVSTNSSNIAVIETAISSTIPAAIATAKSEAKSEVLIEVSTKYVTADAENNLSINGQTIVLCGGNAGGSTQNGSAAE